MTEEEWKAFNKLPGNTVYVLDDSDKPQPWKIQSTYPTGATLYKGQGLAKQWVSRHYRQILIETQKAEYQAECQKAHELKKHCVICGALFTGGRNKKTCGPECSKTLYKQTKSEYSAQRRAERKEAGALCKMCGEWFMPDNSWQKN